METQREWERDILTCGMETMKGYELSPVRTGEGEPGNVYFEPLKSDRPFESNMRETHTAGVWRWRLDKLTKKSRSILLDKCLMS